MAVNIYDYESQAGSLGQDYITKRQGFESANNVYTQANAAYTNSIAGDPASNAKRDWANKFGMEYDKAMSILSSVPDAVMSSDGRAKGLAIGLSPQIQSYNKWGNFDYNQDWLALKNGLMQEYNWILGYYKNRSSTEMQNKEALTNAQTQLTNATATMSTAGGQYDQLKFQREAALKAVRSGRLQQRLQDNPYKVL